MELRTSPAIVNDSVSILESLNFKPIPIPRTNTAIMIIPIPIFIFCLFELLKITVLCMSSSGFFATTFRLAMYLFLEK